MPVTKERVSGEDFVKLKAYLHDQIDKLTTEDVELCKDSIILVDHIRIKTKGMHEVVVPTAKLFTFQGGNNG